MFANVLSQCLESNKCHNRMRRSKEKVIKKKKMTSIDARVVRRGENLCAHKWHCHFELTD